MYLIYKYRARPCVILIIYTDFKGSPMDRGQPCPFKIGTTEQTHLPVFRQAKCPSSVWIHALPSLPELSLVCGVRAYELTRSQLIVPACTLIFGHPANNAQRPRPFT